MLLKHEFTEPFGLFDITNSILQINPWQKIAIELSLIFSSICLIISFIVYSLISELRTVPGKCLMGLIGAQMFTNIFLLLALCLPPRTYECFIVGILLNYFSLTTMYWTNIIGYDLMRKMLNPMAKRGRSHFKRYFFIVFFVPAIIVSFSIMFEFTVDKTGRSIFKPEYGK